MVSEELLQKVRLLEIRSRRAVNEVFTGEYASAFKGRGMEFAEVRAYQPGDDVRAIDWNVTARTGEPHVKRFIEERELTVMLVVDVSGSTAFGSRGALKRDTAAELAALLGFAASRSNDKVGLLLHTDRIERSIPPAKGQHHVARVVHELMTCAPEGRGTEPVRPLERLTAMLKRRAIVFLVSDWLLPGPAEGFPPGLEPALRVLARRHDVVVTHVRDPRELELPRAGLVELEDAETGARRLLDTSSRRVRRRYAALAAAHGDAVRSLARRCGADHLAVRVDRPYLRALIELFRRREARR